MWAAHTILNETLNHADEKNHRASALDERQPAVKPPNGAALPACPPQLATCAPDTLVRAYAT